MLGWSAVAQGGIFLDDFENKDLNENQAPEESGAKEPDSAGENGSTRFEDELVTELEGIRDLLQTELDKADDPEYVQGELIQELDEIDEAAVDDDDCEKQPKRICECCGENECDTSFGEDYPYCSECRKLMTASPAHVGGILMLIIMVLVGVFSSVFLSSDATAALMKGKIGEAAASSMSSLSEYISLIEAETAYEQGKLYDAGNAYESYVSQHGENDSFSAVAVKRLVKIYYNLGMPGNAANIIDQYSDRIPALKSGEFAEISEFNKSLTATVNAAASVYQAIQSGEKIDYDKQSKALDEILEKGTDDNGTAYSPFVVEFYRYLLMQSTDKDLDKQLEQLLKVEEIDKEEHPSFYVSFIIDLYARLGDTENAGKYFEKCVKTNAQDDNAYVYYANAFRFCEKPDADKILEIAEKAKDNAPASSLSYQSIYALGYLLKGDGENAFKAISAYVDSGSGITVSGANIYALCAAYIKDDESYQRIEEIFANASKEIDSNVKKYKKGKLTLEQVLTDVGGDI